MIPQVYSVSSLKDLNIKVLFVISRMKEGKLHLCRMAILVMQFLEIELLESSNQQIMNTQKDMGRNRPLSASDGW